MLNSSILFTVIVALLDAPAALRVYRIRRLRKLSAPPSWHWIIAADIAERRRKDLQRDTAGVQRVPDR